MPLGRNPTFDLPVHYRHLVNAEARSERGLRNPLLHPPFSDIFSESFDIFLSRLRDIFTVEGWHESFCKGCSGVHNRNFDRRKKGIGVTFCLYTAERHSTGY